MPIFIWKVCSFFHRKDWHGFMLLYDWNALREAVRTIWKKESQVLRSSFSYLSRGRPLFSPKAEITVGPRCFAVVFSRQSLKLSCCLLSAPPCRPMPQNSNGLVRVICCAFHPRCPPACERFRYEKPELGPVQTGSVVRWVACHLCRDWSDCFPKRIYRRLMLNSMGKRSLTSALGFPQRGCAKLTACSAVLSSNGCPAER